MICKPFFFFVPKAILLFLILVRRFQNWNQSIGDANLWNIFPHNSSSSTQSTQSGLFSYKTLFPFKKFNVLHFNNKNHLFNLYKTAKEMMMQMKAIVITPAPEMMNTKSSLKESLFTLSVWSNTSVFGVKMLFLASFRSSGSEIPESKMLFLMLKLFLPLWRILLTIWSSSQLNST